MLGSIIALILFATLIGSGVYMRVRTWIDHGPLADGELGDVPRIPEGLRSQRGELPGGMGDARRPLGYATRQHDGSGI